jgi:hypothetical protein
MITTGDVGNLFSDSEAEHKWALLSVSIRLLAMWTALSSQRVGGSFVMITRSRRFLGLGWAIAAWAVIFAGRAMAVPTTVYSEDFEAPLPGSASNGPATYVVVNNPAPGWQVQGGSATNVTLTAGVDLNGVGGSQALFANWDQSGGTVYAFNQYTVYGPGGPAAVNPLGAGIAVPLSQVQVSCDIFVSGYTNPANQIQIDYQSNKASGTTDSVFRSTLTNNDYKHIVFTLNQTDNAANVDTTVPFNFRVEHGADILGFAANQILRLDNVLVQILDAPVPVAGDYNGNGIVDAADYAIWRSTFGQTVTPGTGADGDGNGTIGSGDFDFWKLHFGATGGAGAGLSAASAVPEPSSLLLAIGGMVTMLAARRIHG